MQSAKEQAWKEYRPGKEYHQLMRMDEILVYLKSGQQKSMYTAKQIGVPTLTFMIRGLQQYRAKKNKDTLNCDNKITELNKVIQFYNTALNRISRSQALQMDQREYPNLTELIKFYTAYSGKVTTIYNKYVNPSNRDNKHEFWSKVQMCIDNYERLADNYEKIKNIRKSCDNNSQKQLQYYKGQVQTLTKRLNEVNYPISAKQIQCMTKLQQCLIYGKNTYQQFKGAQSKYSHDYNLPIGLFDTLESEFTKIRYVKQLLYETIYINNDYYSSIEGSTLVDQCKCLAQQVQEIISNKAKTLHHQLQSQSEIQVKNMQTLFNIYNRWFEAKNRVLNEIIAEAEQSKKQQEQKPIQDRDKDKYRDSQNIRSVSEKPGLMKIFGKISLPPGCTAQDLGRLIGRPYTGKILNDQLQQVSSTHVPKLQSSQERLRRQSELQQTHERLRRQSELADRLLLGCTDYKTDNQYLSSRVNTLVEQYTKVSAENKRILGISQQWMDKYHAKLTQCQALNTKYHSIIEDYQANKVTVKTLNTQLTQATAQQHKLKSQLAQATAQMTKLKSRDSINKHQLSVTKQTKQKLIKNLQQQINQKQSTIATLTLHLQQKDKQMAQEKQSADKVRTALTKLSQRYQLQTNKNKDLIKYYKTLFKIQQNQQLQLMDVMKHIQKVKQKQKYLSNQNEKNISFINSLYDRLLTKKITINNSIGQKYRLEQIDTDERKKQFILSYLSQQKQEQQKLTQIPLMQSTISRRNKIETSIGNTQMNDNQVQLKSSQNGNRDASANRVIQRQLRNLRDRVERYEKNIKILKQKLQKYEKDGGCLTEQQIFISQRNSESPTRNRAEMESNQDNKKKDQQLMVRYKTQLNYKNEQIVMLNNTLKYMKQKIRQLDEELIIKDSQLKNDNNTIKLKQQLDQKVKQFQELSQKYNKLAKQSKKKTENNQQEELRQSIQQLEEEKKSMGRQHQKAKKLIENIRQLENQKETLQKQINQTKIIMFQLQQVHLKKKRSVTQAQAILVYINQMNEQENVAKKKLQSTRSKTEEKIKELRLIEQKMRQTQQKEKHLRKRYDEMSQTLEMKEKIKMQEICKLQKKIEQMKQQLIQQGKLGSQTTINQRAQESQEDLNIQQLKFKIEILEEQLELEKKRSAKYQKIILQSKKK